MGEPLLGGTFHRTMARRSPRVAVTPVAAPGTVAGVAVVVAAGPVPYSFVATTESA